MRREWKGREVVTFLVIFQPRSYLFSKNVGIHVMSPQEESRSLKVAVIMETWKTTYVMVSLPRAVLIRSIKWPRTLLATQVRKGVYF